MKQKELSEYICQKKRELGGELTIFAHNFTAEDILPFADVIGDSATLAKATQESKSRFLLFAAAKFFSEVTGLTHVAESIQSIIDYKKGTGELKYRLNVPDKHRVLAKKAIETMFEMNQRMGIFDEVVHF
jgi:hypothetical protein